MLDLDELFKKTANPLCEGCTILNKPLSDHAIMDHDSLEPKDVMFVSDSLKLANGDYYPFRYNELKTIRRIVESTGYSDDFNVVASVKCPSITADTISTDDRKICRSHITQSIVKLKPKLVFACGKLPTLMVYGKALAEKNGRGVQIPMELGGHKFTFVQVYHPYQVIAEPKNLPLFEIDIINAINSVILGKVNKSDFSYEVVDSVDRLNELAPLFLGTGNVAIDIETTGLNFLEGADKINTIALSVESPDGQKTISIPVDHKDSKVGYKFKAELFKFLDKMFSNPNNKKILQNAKFDLKFLKKYGVEEFVNIYDTKLIQHFYYEGIPKGLKDLIHYYFPHEDVLCS